MVLREAVENAEPQLEQLQEEGYDISEEEENDAGLHEEILAYRKELFKFGLTLERLADEAVHMIERGMHGVDDDGL